MTDTVKQLVPEVDVPHGTIRLVPSLSISALKHGLDKELAMWYCLRAINHWGSGRLDMDYAARSLVDHFRYSRSTVYRILSAGDGIFWKTQSLKNINKLEIKIKGLNKLAGYFGTRCGNYFFEISPQDFVGKGQNRVSRQRSWLYSSFHKPVGTKTFPISRASIQTVTGVTRRSQQRYDKIAVKSIANFADKQDPDGGVITILEYVNDKNKQWLVHRQLGNTYFCRSRRSATGMLNKVNTAVRQSSQRGEACYLRRFFITARSYIKCLQRHLDPYIIVNPANRWTPGMNEWCTMNP